jgi:hypothetical protein
MKMKEEKGQFIPQKLALFDFKVINENIDVAFEFNSELIKNYETDMSFNITFDQSNKCVKVDLGFDIHTNSSEQTCGEARAQFNFVYVYSLQNFDDFVEHTKDKIKKVNEQLIVAVADASFSTSRGVIMTRLQNTVLKDFILPIIAPEDLFEKSGPDKPVITK